MFIRTLITAVCFSLTLVILQAKIIETSYIEEVIPLIDNETWFLVDLDNCMFEGKDALGHANWFYDQVQQRMDRGMSRDNAIRDFYPDWVITQKICRVKPLEENFIPALLRLQEKGICVMGLTHRQPLIADSTVRQVASLGFDFIKTAPSCESYTFPAKSSTLYYQGILFVGDYNNKSDVFRLFLATINRVPKKVVFIDDKRKNVEDLEVLASYGIEYIGVHYTAIERAEPRYFREIAQFQYQFLTQIISNEAARCLMEHSLQ